MFRLSLSTGCLGVLLVALSCKPTTPDNQFPTDAIAADMKVLASDDFQGRRPFTDGETKTVAYLQQQFKAIGFEPGNGDSYVQAVPMAEITTMTDSVMPITGGKQPLRLSGRRDFILWTDRPEPEVKLEQDELVFVGFGVVAPEYGWNDYAGLDMKNKIAVVLVNDPGFGGDDTTFFKGNTMTYYGRWTYKHEEATRQGAKGCLVIHNTVPAGYGFNVPQVAWNNPHLLLDDRGQESYKCAGLGWLSYEATQQLFDAAGLDFRQLQTDARKPGFKAVPMKLKASATMHNTVRYNQSYNVIAKITGTTHPDEVVIYSAHWDHLGIGKKDEKGDSIYNGAGDNASGTAGLLALARATTAQPKPDRTVVFLSFTAEEQGLWGSAYYVSHPVYPLAKTVANINMDMMNPWGKTKDIVVIGIGQNDLEDNLRAAAAKVNRYVAREPSPQAGLYFRSDHFHFAKVGVPALFATGGIDHAEKGIEYGRQQQSDFTAKRYHRPSDEFDPALWHLDGVADNLQLLFNVGDGLSRSAAWPQWKPTSEFKDIKR
ncbi:MAG: M28 family peptidase [Cyclobacteriaceae bacterium]|nr:M28 family peptidase [Cyclobacteriaceae bacterium]